VTLALSPALSPKERILRAKSSRFEPLNQVRRAFPGRAANNVLRGVPLAILTFSLSVGTAGKMHGSTFRFMERENISARHEHFGVLVPFAATGCIRQNSDGYGATIPTGLRLVA
jgi:hypothetical protein